MKGQILVGGAAMFVVLLALIATSLTAAPASPATIVTASQLDNLAQEYRHATGLSALDSINHIDTLSEYFRVNVQGFDAIYALIAIQPGSYDVTIGNFLRNPISVSVSASGSAPASAMLQDKSKTSFAFTASGSVHFTISYTINNNVYNQSLDFAADKNQTISWFDAGINADNSNVRRSDIWIVGT